MSLFRPEPTSIAEWQSLVAEAEVRTGYDFDESIENYLVITLDHYTDKETIASVVLAIEFLSGTSIERPRDGVALRKVGDQCLLLSGLFPERALNKNVSLNYFIGVGQQAYLALTDTRLRENFDSDLFQKLSINFVGLMDLLHSMRHHSLNL